MLVKTLPFIKETLTQMSRVVDLEKLALKVLANNKSCGVRNRAHLCIPKIGIIPLF